MPPAEDDTTINQDQNQEPKGAEGTPEPKPNEADAGAAKGADGDAADGKGKEPKPDGDADDAKPETRKAADGDDVDVDDKGSVTMPFSAFQRRLTRAANQATRSALKDIFGTDDASQIKKMVKQGKEAQASLDKTRREQMTEVEKLKEDNERLRARAEEEGKLSTYEEDQLAEKGEKVVAGIAGKFISGDYVEDAVASYQRHLAKLSNDELGQLDAKDIEEWFKEYASRKPALARKPGERRKVQEPASNGPDPAKKPEPAKPGSNTSKTPRPNQQNSMTKQEWEEYKRQRGLNF